jgi:hypothetical protein
MGMKGRWRKRFCSIARPSRTPAKPAGLDSITTGHKVGGADFKWQWLWIPDLPLCGNPE